jgi:hypothetical protein
MLETQQWVVAHRAEHVLQGAKLELGQGPQPGQRVLQPTVLDVLPRRQKDAINPAAPTA